MKQITFNGNKNIIGEQLFLIRRKLNLSQSELAAKMQLYNINIDQQMISKIEKNQRQVTDFELACFCKCLNVKPETILINFEQIISKL